MAKKPKAPQPDSDGYLRTGIYQQYVGPSKEISEDELEQKYKEHCESFNQPAVERLESIREWLFSILKPHITGPISQEKARSEPGVHRAIDDGKGIKTYTFADGITAKQNGSVEAKQVQGALDAVYQLNIIRHNLESGNVNLVVRSSIALGQIMERITIRASEPNALRGGKVLKAATAGGKLNAALTLEQQKKATAAVTTLISAGDSQNIACKKVARDYRVSMSTIKRVFQASKK